MRIYINIDERYGDRAECTIADYQRLNPTGYFFEVGDQIREYIDAKPYSVRIPRCVAVLSDSVELTR